MNDGVCLIVDVDPARLHRRVEHRYLDEVADDLDDAVEQRAGGQGRAPGLSVGVVGNAAEVFPELLRRGVPIDIVTDQTWAHDPLSLPARGRLGRGLGRRTPRRSPRSSPTGPAPRWPGTSQAMVGFMDAGAEVFDYGNSIRDEARRAATSGRSTSPGFVPAYIRPLFCEGKGPFRWVALSGDPDGHRRHRPGRARPVPRQRPAAPVDPRRRRADRASRACRPGSAGSATASATWPAWRSTTWCASGELQAPIVIGRDHLDCRLGRLPLPRDRGDGRRLRRHRRLAAAQRAGQHRLRRLLGVDPPRRRRRHRPLDPRRPGLAGRRHRRWRRRSSSGC